MWSIDIFLEMNLHYLIDGEIVQTDKVHRTGKNIKFACVRYRNLKFVINEDYFQYSLR